MIKTNNFTGKYEKYQDHAHIGSQCGARVGNTLQIQFSSPQKARVGPTLAYPMQSHIWVALIKPAWSHFRKPN